MYSELERYRQGLAEYIEATYHISHPTLVRLRAELLRREGTIAQRPYLESTPRYQGERRFAALDIPAPVGELLTALGRQGAVFDPPYDHQAQALEQTLTHGRDLLVTTGTGSGKTETFLLPLLGHLYREAAERPISFRRRGLRALILYPMNALVNDQLNRLRLLFGREDVMEMFRAKAGRPAKFARYTGRSLFPGELPRADDEDAAQKLRERLRPLDFYLELLERAEQADAAGEASRALIGKLREGGRWPAKRDLARWYKGSAGGRWFAGGRLARVTELPDDAELLLRHEVQQEPPDLLMTNYSMLEYTLLRPLERSIWRSARDRFAAQPEDRLMLVLDEAHLYRGAGGAEVALLLRRLRQRLGLSADRVQVICTSASFEEPAKALDFVSALSGKPRAGFVRLTGTRRAWPASGPGDAAVAEALSRVELPALLGGDARARARSLQPLLASGGAPLEGRAISVRGLSPAGLRLWALAVDGRLRELEPDPGATHVRGDWIAVVDAACAGAPTAPVEIGLVGEAPSLRLGPDGLVRLTDPLQRPLFALLSALPVAGRLVNLTSDARLATDPETSSGGAQEIARLADRLFPEVTDVRCRRDATDALIELACVARGPDDRPLLAARAHAFFRGLPGLWACLDPQCPEVPGEARGGPTGALYAQPLDRCRCGARVLELHTCRGCGTAFAHGFAEHPERPSLLWREQGEHVREDAPALFPVQIMLEGPYPPAAAIWMDTLSGRLGTDRGRPREVWLAPSGQSRDGAALPLEERGLFMSCPRCKAVGGQISGHMTSGDQPFQELVSTQLLTQPPRPEVRTPLQGRKVMIFSDGRQKASRLSGNLKAFSLRDAARPLLLLGFRALRDELGLRPTLDHAYLALLIGCVRRGVTLPSAPALRGDLEQHVSHVAELLRLGDGRDRAAAELSAFIAKAVPADVIQEIHGVLFQPYTGVEALALGSFAAEIPGVGRAAFERLPAPPAQGISPAQAREALLSRWVQLAARGRMIYLPGTPADKVATERSALVYRRAGGFQSPLRGDLGGTFHRRQLGPGGDWITWLQQNMAATGGATADGIIVDAARVRLLLADEVELARCERCARVQARSPITARCTGCEAAELRPLAADADERFRARAAYYRRLHERAERDPSFAPHPFVAAEHSAAISQTMEGELFARTEEYELRFQDVPIPDEHGRPQGPVDVLSCTTTMEVGVDIGSLTGVALRNVPPGRANYQQRAGRAGRRGSALATVITYAGADGHDQRFFNDPEGMVAGPVKDPVIKIENLEIVRRQAFAMLLSLYQQDAIGDAAAGRAHLFMSLGTLREFREGAPDRFSYAGLRRWLGEREDVALRALDELVPEELPDRDAEIERLPGLLLERLGAAGAGPLPESERREDARPGAMVALAEADRAGVVRDMGEDYDDFSPREPAEEPPARAARVGGEDEEAALNEDLLLDRLFAKAVLPRYAFPTDVVSFHVFDERATSRYQGPVLRYSPQQGLTAALGQYAPGRDVWVDGLKWHSMAIYTRYGRDLKRAWKRQQLYLECSRCHFAEVRRRGEGVELGDTADCPACRSKGGMRPAMRWFSPPGFAHPVDLPAELPGANEPPLTRPTRAKLSAPFDTAERAPVWETEGVQVWEAREDLIVTNTGSEHNADRPGFLYCLRCGRTEPNGWADGKLGKREPHPRPAPARRGELPTCEGSPVPITLGTSFRTDICLIRLRLRGGAAMPPGSAVARVALTSIAEAVAAAAREALQLDAGEVAAEHRPAQTARGETGEEMEIYLYDAVPGGAGYSAAAARLRAPNLLELALKVLEECRESCTSSCYACLRSYQNRWLHGSLDRRLAAELVRHCLYGEPLVVSVERARPHLDAMASWLSEDGAAVAIDGDRLIVNGHPVVLTHPLRPDAAPEGVRGVSLLLAQRALPDACLLARGESLDAGRGARRETPRGLTVDLQGAPAYLSGALNVPLDAASSIGRFALPGGASGRIIVRLDTPNLEEHEHEGIAVGEGVWAVFSVAPTGEQLEAKLKDWRVALVRRSEGHFHGTGASWTVGVVRRQSAADGAVRLTVKYRTHRESGRQESIALEHAQIIGFLERVLP